MMKYHPNTDAVVYPFNEDSYSPDDLYPLSVVTPASSAGGIMVANTPTLDGGEYVLTYTVLESGSAEWVAWFQENT